MKYSYIFATSIMTSKTCYMEKLTAKEEEVLDFFWKKGPLYVREIVELYDDPKPHFNTISTIVRALEEKGYLSHTFSSDASQWEVVSLHYHQT